MKLMFVIDGWFDNETSNHQNAPLPFGKTEFVIAWLFREVTASLLFVKALWDPEIRWRTGTYKLKWGGIAEEIKKEEEKKVDCEKA